MVSAGLADAKFAKRLGKASAEEVKRMLKLNVRAKGPGGWSVMSLAIVTVHVNAEVLARVQAMQPMSEEERALYHLFKEWNHGDPLNGGLEAVGTPGSAPNFPTVFRSAIKNNDIALLHLLTAFRNQPFLLLPEEAEGVLLVAADSSSPTIFALAFEKVYYSV